MKKILLFALSMLLVITTTGCKSKKEDVKLLTKKEMAIYAEENYGKANVINEEQKDSSIIYTLQDEEYKFNYTCTSYVYEAFFDATSMGYTRGLTSDFDKQYKDYIVKTINLDNIYDAALTINRAGDDVLFSIYYENEKEAKEDIEIITNKIKELDKRDYFKNYYIGVYDNNEYIGSFNIDSKEYKNKYEEYVGQMTGWFAAEVNNTNVDLEGITYLYYKRVQYKDVERLKMEWLHNKNLTPEDWTTAYYFDYKGETYFMLDDLVFIEEAEGINGKYHYSDYYTSYWFN